MPAQPLHCLFRAAPPWVLFVLLATQHTARAAGPPVDFSREILPILSDNCFRCHGPDARARKAKLRLDTPEGALRKSDPVIVPGKSADSELVRRIASTETADVMPPPKSNRQLSPRQVELLRRWIDEGAH